MNQSKMTTVNVDLCGRQLHRIIQPMELSTASTMAELVYVINYTHCWEDKPLHKPDLIHLSYGSSLSTCVNSKLFTYLYSVRY
jgi:hypothetical protein